MTSPLVPDLEALKPWLDRLEANEGSVVLIALESFQTRNDCRCTVGWFNADEKKALRSALIKCRKKREAARPFYCVKLPCHPTRHKNGCTQTRDCKRKPRAEVSQGESMLPTVTR
jgi:hypothetical protein